MVYEYKTYKSLIYTSINLPCAPEFAISFGQIFKLRLTDHLGDAGIDPKTRFDLISMRVPKLLLLRRQSLEYPIRYYVFHTCMHIYIYINNQIPLTKKRVMITTYR